MDWRQLHGAVAAAGVLCSLCTISAAAEKRDPLRENRLRMVEEFIAKEGVTNSRVLDAMRTVPRHEFVPTRLKTKAYFDTALPIGHQQTISPPFIVAYMTESIDPQPDDRVLEIGTGSGYQAAVLSLLVKDVYTIEIVEPLGKAARTRLDNLGYKNVHVRIGDGYQGWPEAAPFDKIIVTCSPEDVPRPLIEQLKDGGKMIIPLGERYQQVFHLFEKREGQLVATRLIPTLFVPMTGISEEQRKIKPDPENPRIVNGGFETDENGDGRADGWHYQRQARWDAVQPAEGERCLTFENSTPGEIAQALQGMAVNGRRVAGLKLACRARYERATVGAEPWQRPGLIVHFYDEERRPIGDAFLGSWIGTDQWGTYQKIIEVPKRAREAIVQIGLNGGTGTLSVDTVELQAVPRGN